MVNAQNRLCGHRAINNVSLENSHIDFKLKSIFSGINCFNDVSSKLSIKLRSAV